MQPSPGTLIARNAGRGLLAKLRKQNVISIALASLVCCTTLNFTGCGNNPLGNQDIGGFPGKGTVIGIALGAGGGVAAATIIAVHHSHHTVKACILSGPNGLEVQENSGSTFELAGLTADVKVGNSYRLHGSKLKRAKHAPGNRTFLIETVGKDYGPCSAKPAGLALSASYR